MSYQIKADNVYAVGSVIKAKEAPGVALMINKYLQRIYYCSVIGDEAAKQKVYFERELIAP